MIRAATIDDKERVIGLLKNSRVGAGFDAPTGPTGFVFPFDPAYAERLFLTHLTHHRGFCIVLDIEGCAEGVLMAFAAEHPFGPVMIARETLWWIEPARRGRAALKMLDAYDAWWQAQGCAFGGMAGMGEDPAVAHLYRRRGYRLAETHYLKAA